MQTDKRPLKKFKTVCIWQLFELLIDYVFSMFDQIRQLVFTLLFTV